MSDPSADSDRPDAPAFLAGSARECCDCEQRHGPDEDFTYRGLHLCINCMSSLISWFLDGGFADEPDRYDWTGIDLLPAPFDDDEPAQTDASESPS